MRSSQIAALVGGSRQQLLRRLQLLYHHGFLERPRCQLDFYYRGGSREIVYGLADKGAALLRQAGISVPESRWSEKNRSIGRVQLEHVVLVSGIMTAVELSCRENGTCLLTESDLRTTRSFQWNVRVDNQAKLGIRPDRVFGIEYRRPDGRPERAYFFLEADRGTMPVKRKDFSHTSFHRKLLAYEATWEQDVHRTRFDFHRFRVLTVTASAARLQSLIKACSDLKHARSLFLFADETILKNPTQLFSAAWRSGTGEAARPLD